MFKHNTTFTRDNQCAKCLGVLYKTCMQLLSSDYAMKLEKLKTHYDLRKKPFESLTCIDKNLGKVTRNVAVFLPIYHNSVANAPNPGYAPQMTKCVLQYLHHTEMPQNI